MLKITGTFLDEVSIDIASLNYSEIEWDREFASMKKTGIDKAILIRCGLQRFTAFPAKVLANRVNSFPVPEDLVAMFLRLAEKHDIKFYFGTYFSGNDWLSASYDREAESDLMSEVCDEFWTNYGKYSSAFGGWYLSQEISDKRSFNVVKCYRNVGTHCKRISNGLPVMISPYICGPKYGAGQPRRAKPITLDEHRDAWDGIFEEVKGIVDIAAFQDGHVDYENLEDFLRVSKECADKHSIQLWVNTETFDRDVPGTLPAIKWQKLWLKLAAAERAGITNAITFEFSHFFSPHSPCPGAANLWKRYCEYAKVNLKEKGNR